ncbi:hypothetical protein HOG98_03015 [bacterium]|nr:hypothetical protein [bacterium]
MFKVISIPKIKSLKDIKPRYDLYSQDPITAQRIEKMIQTVYGLSRPHHRSVFISDQKCSYTFVSDILLELEKCSNLTSSICPQLTKFGVRSFNMRKDLFSIAEGIQSHPQSNELFYKLSDILLKRAVIRQLYVNFDKLSGVENLPNHFKKDLENLDKWIPALEMDCLGLLEEEEDVNKFDVSPQNITTASELSGCQLEIQVVVDGSSPAQEWHVDTQLASIAPVYFVNFYDKTAENKGTPIFRAPLYKNDSLKPAQNKSINRQLKSLVIEMLNHSTIDNSWIQEFVIHCQPYVLIKNVPILFIHSSPIDREERKVALFRHKHSKGISGTLDFSNLKTNSGSKL